MQNWFLLLLRIAYAAAAVAAFCMLEAGKLTFSALLSPALAIVLVPVVTPGKEWAELKKARVSSARFLALLRSAVSRDTAVLLLSLGAFLLAERFAPELISEPDRPLFAAFAVAALWIGLFGLKLLGEFALWLPPVLMAILRWLFGSRWVTRVDRIQTFDEVQKRLDGITRERRLEDNGRPVIWGGLEIPPALLPPNFMVMGSVGSGKTNTIRMLMSSALLGDEGRPRHHALVYDPKLDLYPVLRRIGFARDRIRVLHPLDTRCCAWDLARDIADPVSVKQLAGSLVPDIPGDPNQFFTRAARGLLEGVVNAFRLTVKNGDWNLNDVIEATKTPARLRKVLEKTEQGRHLVATYLKIHKRSEADHVATLASNITNFDAVAGLWGRKWHDGKTISLQDWLSDAPSILLFATDEKNYEALDPINRVLFRRAVELVLGRPGEPDDEVWFILDELQLASKLEGLDRLLLKGRSKAARCVLGFQAFEGLQAVYGQELADAIVGQAENKAILRLDSVASMRWAASYFNRREYVAVSRTRGYQHGSVTAQVAVQDVVMEAEFREFLPSSKHFGLTGAFNVPELGPWKGTIPPEYVEAHKGTKKVDDAKDGADASLLPREEYEQEELPWALEDLERLGLPHTIDEPSESDAPGSSEGFESADDDDG